jgi:hypothetical protein
MKGPNITGIHLHSPCLLLVAAVLVGLIAPRSLLAGGPAYVAGVTYFNSGMAGQIVSWPQGNITYYTDRGSLSSLLNSSAADAFVADAFSRWASVPTAALNITRGGQLAEDVSGANVVRNSDGTITVPADVLPSALDHPVGIVYDSNGQVTDALLGIGSGARAACFSNAVIGGPDAFTTDGAIAHALVVINGNCIQATSDLLESKYRLVRVLGSVLGLDWSQLNLNVLAGVPTHPTADDKAGFPLMHALDSPNCVPITLCYQNPDQLKMDDRAAIARLYPVTDANAAQFPGKQKFAATTARIYGSVFFTDTSGNPAQPMQCVNVVARWIDPGTGQPSGQYAASSVSGFLFVGNAGNPVTGRTDATGNRYDRWGSQDPAFEGFFDLSGLEIPNGDVARFQLSIEPLDPDWSQQVGPCAPQQVSPSGSFAPLIVTLTKGNDLKQDIPMLGSAQEQEDPNRSNTYSSPLPLPATGAWLGSLSRYGDSDYFSFSARANRTFSVDVLALDENAQSTQAKARPVAGVWLIGDPQTMAPEVATPVPFNRSVVGLTQLNVQVLSASMLRLGIADWRGDGRPDFRYRAQLLYGDYLDRDRISVRGGQPVSIRGIGFKPGMIVTVGKAAASILSVSNQQIVFTAPAFTDGPQTITVTNPSTGGSSQLQSALMYGVASTDQISISNNNPAIPVGTQTPYPIRATVTGADGSPVAGATVQWTVNNTATMATSGCGSFCYGITDDQGHAEARVNVKAAGTTTVTAQLAPLVYSGIQAQTTLVSTYDQRNIALTPYKLWVMEGTTIDVPLASRVVTSTGTAVSGLKLNFLLIKGTASLSVATANTDSSGYARTNVHVDSLSGEVDVRVCADAGGITCPTFTLFKVAASDLRLLPVAGSQQTIALGDTFGPLWIRVVDSSSPPNPVFGAPVAFESDLFQMDGTSPAQGGNDDNVSTRPAQKVKLGSWQTTVISDGDGFVNILPPNGDGSRALEVDIAVTAGARAFLNYVLQAVPTPATTTSRPQSAESAPLEKQADRRPSHSAPRPR